jgi:hypothetical protein
MSIPASGKQELVRLTVATKELRSSSSSRDANECDHRFVKNLVILQNLGSHILGDPQKGT